MTRFDKIQADKDIQDLWIKRFIAAIIDGVIIAIPTYIIYTFFLYAFLLTFLFVGLFWVGYSVVMSLLFGVLWILYFAFMEGGMGATLGKQFMNLQVRSTDGGAINTSQAFTRNISKIHWLFFLLDLLVGLFTEGDPRQRYMDQVAGTVVIKKGAPAPIALKDFKYCIHCGEKVPTKSVYCPKCGKKAE